MASPLPVGPGCSREDFEMEDGADENIQIVVSYLLPRPMTADDPSDLDGSPPRILGLRLLAYPPGVAWTVRNVLSDLMTSVT